MRKRPTPHLQRKRNRRDRRVYYPLPELLHISAGLLARTLTLAKLHFGPPEPDGKTVLQAMQDLVAALPPEQDEYTLVGTREFFASKGIDPKTLAADGPELSPEELRKLWGGK